MSKASTPPASQATTPNTSAWSRGPPPAVSNPSSNVPSAVSTPPPPPTGASVNEQATGSTPVAIGGGNSRKGTMMVGGNGDVMPRGNLAFGTVDSPNPLLSSSPAAPSTTGGHLADAVKSFGSIDAETNATTGASMIRPPRRTSGGANPTTPSGAPQKKLDVHSLFAGKPQTSGAVPVAPMSPSQAPPVGSPQDRRQSIPTGGFPGANGMPNSGPHMYQQMPGMSGQPHLRPPQGMPGQPRSPVMGGGGQPQFGGQVPQPGYRVPQPQMQGGQQPVRPTGGSGPMGGPRPMPQGMPYGMPHGQAGYPMMYPGQSGYYAAYNPYEQGYGVPQPWVQQQQHQQQQQQQQHNMPLSPRSAQAQLGQQPSPAPPNANLPGSAGGSPMPTPPSRPQSLVGAHQSTASNASVSPMPSTPSRPMQPGTPFTPQMTPGSQGGPLTPSLSAGAMAFTPRTKQAIKISRPDGTSVNLAEAAAAAKGPTSSSTSGVATPEAVSADEPPKKKMPTLPVIVRLESEDQKKARLAEDEKRKKIQEQEAKEEQERKERVERRAKEEQERKLQEEEDKKKEEDSKKEAEAAAQAKAEAKADAEAKAATEAEAEAEAAAAKTKEEAVTPAPVPAEEVKPAAEVKSEEPSGSATPVDKVEEQRRALMTPTTQSVAPSPLASPALAAAGLPAKPVSALNGARRPTPSAVDTKSASQASSSAPSASAGPSALSTAKAIDDLAAVEYPESIKAQSAGLNANSEPGKYRYDRDFLMQFMEVCKEKPDSLPPLEEIGLEADTGSSFGGNRRGPNRASGGGTSRIMAGGNRNFPGQSMGAFNFSGVNKSTSEERYNRSLLAGGRQGSNMMRQGSAGGSLPPMHGGLPLGHSSSRTGHNRSSGRGTKRMPQDRSSSVNDPDVAPLAVSANAWVNARSAGSDEKSPVYIERKVKALLNKLTEEKFDSIATQILEWANKSRNESDGMTLKLVIKLVFEKSTDEAHWSAMYAKLCRLLLDRLDPAITEVIDGKSVSGGNLFRKYLLGRCQADFESGWKAREEAALAATAKSEEDKERLAKIEENKEKENAAGVEGEEKKEESGDVVMLSDEYYIAQKAKRRGLGLVQLIGELYKLEMLSTGVIRTCLVRLLGNVQNPDEEDLESTCKLLTTVGRQFEESSSSSMDVVFERLLAIVKNDTISSRIKFMLMDVVDLRRNRWTSRKAQVPTTIAQIHQQAARENAEKAQAAAAARESISRGGSRAGHSRRDGPQPGEWQSVNAGPRPPQRPADFSNIGRGVSSAALPSAPTFGPSGVFARGKKGNAASNTPPLSRHSSTTNISNMFNVLNEAADGGATDAAAENAPQRKKLQLAPRTKPIPGPGEEGSDDGEEEEEGEDAEGDAEADADAAPSMTESAAQAKIATDLKELWGEKDAGGSRNPDDIAEYYRALPTEHRHLLSEKLSEDVFRIAKLRDAQVVANGWQVALKEEVASTEDLKAGLEARMPTLDDDAIDFPQAYKAIAVLIRSLSLEAAEVDALLERVEVYGTPRITPKMKLDKAFTQVDEEAAASA